MIKLQRGGDITFASHSLGDGRAAACLHFRATSIDDERRLCEFFASHTEETIYLRYGMLQREMTHERAVHLLQLDGHDEFALLGLVGIGPAERIVAIGRYALDEATGLAEVAFVVHEAYRGMGIATHLLRCLVDAMHANNFAGVTAQVLSRNAAMLGALDKVLGVPSETSSGCGEETLIWRFGKQIG